MISINKAIEGDLDEQRLEAQNLSMLIALFLNQLLVCVNVSVQVYVALGKMIR